MRKTKDSNFKDPSLFFLNFQGEYLSILLDASLTTSMETEEGVVSQNLPLTFQAFLIDEDDTYYYMGHIYNLSSPHSGITRAIPKKRVLLAEIVDPADPLTEILDEMKTPSRGEAN